MIMGGVTSGGAIPGRWTSDGAVPDRARDGAGRADVTVVVPVKDRGALLAPTLAAIAAQRPAPAAVVVVDDGSCDDSGEVARRAGAVVVRHETPQGPGAARNAGIRAATTTWIAFCDSDDLWLPGHLAGLMAAAAGHVLVVAPARATSGRWRGNARGHRVPLDPASLLVPGDGLCTSATLVRRETALTVGGFPDLMLAEDLGLWLRLLDVGTGVETAVPTVLYREHAGQMSLDAAAMRTAFTAVVDGFDGFDGRPWLTPRLRVRMHSRLAWDELRAAQRARDPRGVARSLAWYAGHPAALPALEALLSQRFRARRAAAREPLHPDVGGWVARSGDAPASMPGGVTPLG